MMDAVDVEDITTTWLSAALSTDVRSLTLERIGAGQTGATYRLQIDGAEVPSTLIAKVAAGDPSERTVVATGYRNEVNFYRHLSHRVDVRAPRCWHSAISDDGTRFTLLLEDLAPRVPGIQAQGCSVDRAHAAVINLAALHAPLWNDAALYELDFFRAPTVEAAEFVGQIAASATETFLERYIAELDRADVETLRAAAGAVAEWMVARPTPFSAIHGDYRLDNLMFGAGADDVVAVDWQTLAVGPPARDLAYFLGTSLTPDDRRSCELDLVGDYAAGLAGRGVVGYTRSECFEDYRLGQIQGPLITTLGAAFSPAARTDSADEMFVAMAQRSCVAIRELASLELL